MTIQHSHAAHRLTPAADLVARAGAAAAAAGAHAAEVDRAARFPAEALAALREQRLLGTAVPIALGGEGTGLPALADTAFALGRACASSAMIFAMHQTKVACLVRHGGESPAVAAVLRRVADEQLLLASSTTEGQGGGNVRASSAAIERDGEAVVLERAATVISYGAQADGIVTLARRHAEASASDQVLCVFLSDQYTLEPLSGWHTLGMRGTCSTGFRLRARAPAAHVLPARYGDIHARTMTPVSHILWGSAWAGIAASAVETAQTFTRTAMRGAAGTAPPGAAHVSRAASRLRQARALIAAALDRYEAHADDPARLSDLDVQAQLTMLKVEVSELALEAVSAALRATGLAGYREDGPFTLGRQMRDILSAPVMIHNDRILANLATTTLVSPVAASVRD